MKYIVEIEFDGVRHCLNCPLRDTEDDCKLQDCKPDWDWDQQMRKCPLKVKLST